MSVPLRVVPSSTLSSNRCLGIAFLSRADREIAVFRHVAPPSRLPRGSACEPAPPGAGRWETPRRGTGTQRAGDSDGGQGKADRRDRTGNRDPEGDLRPLQEPPPTGVSVWGGATVFTTTTGPLPCFLPAVGCWASPWHPIVGCSPDLVGTS